MLACGAFLRRLETLALYVALFATPEAGLFLLRAVPGEVARFAADMTGVILRLRTVLGDMARLLASSAGLEGAVVFAVADSFAELARLDLTVVVHMLVAIAIPAQSALELVVAWLAATKAALNIVAVVNDMVLASTSRACHVFLALVCAVTRMSTVETISARAVPHAMVTILALTAFVLDLVIFATIVSSIRGLAIKAGSDAEDGTTLVHVVV